ncbi:hypothetical protein U1Q18_041647 [Sarracenia purpurea var. burkii]
MRTRERHQTCGKKSPPPPQRAVGATYGWTTGRLLLGVGYVVGETLRRAQWESCPFACLGHSDELHGSDLGVFIPRSVVPCAAL